MYTVKKRTSKEIEVWKNNEPFVAVRPTPLVPGQQGLFALRAFKADETLGYYRGRVYWKIDDLPEDQSYVAEVIANEKLVNMHYNHKAATTERSGKCWVDGREASAPYLNKINDGRGTGHPCNARLMSSGRIVTTKSIKPGQEILMPYGASYWKN